MAAVMPPSTYDQMLQGMIKQMLAAQPGAPPDTAEKMGRALREVIPYDEMVAITARVYVKYFDDEDIAVLTKFYGSPTGKKTSKLLPEIMSETMKETVALVQQRLPAALEKQGLGPKKQ